jgi:hypothetical protein
VKGVVAVRTAKGLAEALSDPDTRSVHLEAGTYDLTELTAGVAFSGKELQLAASPEGAKIVLFSGAEAGANGNLLPGRLAFHAAKLTVRNIRFEILSPPAQEELFPFGEFPTHPLGIAVQCSESARFIDCTFTDSSPVKDESITLAISAGPEGKSPHVQIERCVFGYRQSGWRGCVALQVPPGIQADIHDSGFGPHGAAIQVVAPKDESPATSTDVTAKIRLKRTSFMLDHASIAVSALSAVEVAAGHCLFGTIETDQVSPPSVFQVARSDGSRFSGILGQKNVYHQVNALTVGNGDTATTYTLGETRSYRVPFADPDGVTVTQRPWSQAMPLEVLSGPEPWRAFALDTIEPALSIPDREVAIVGAQFHSPGTTTRRAYPLVYWPPPNTSQQSPQPRVLVWQPQPAQPDTPLPRNTFTDLATLLKSAQSGDTILIRHTGQVPVIKTIDLEKPRGHTGDFKLTFKPFYGSKPILTGDADAERLDQTLFQLLSGEVVFDGVQFLLKPSRPRNPQTVAAIRLVGGKGCTFTNCVFTLHEEDEAKAAAILVSDPDKVMTMDSGRPTPEIKLDRCIVRGKGRGIWVPVSRAVRVEVSNSLSAIEGPLFLGESAGKLNAARSILKLAHITAFVGGPLVELRGAEKPQEMGLSGLVKVEMDASANLLAGVSGAGQPLVELNGIDATETATLLRWSAQPGNRYVNFDPSAVVMTVRPTGEGNLPKEWNWDRWLTFAGEPPGRPIGSATFENAPASVRDFATVKPMDAKILSFHELPDAKPGDTGVDPKVLPLPWENE